MEFATSTVLSIPYRRTASSPRSPTRADSLGLPSIISTSVISTYTQKSQGIAALLGELECPPELPEALVAVTEVGEVTAEHRERQELGWALADCARERERLLAGRQRLVVAPGHHQPDSQPCERLRALRGGWLCRHELDRALEGGEGGVGPPALVQVATEAVVEARGAQRVARLDQIDRLLCELDRVRRHSRLAGQLGRPGAERGQVEAHQLGRVRHGRPQPERPLQVGEGLRQAEHGLRLACRLDRGGQRLGGAAAAAQ